MKVSEASFTTWGDEEEGGGRKRGREEEEEEEEKQGGDGGRGSVRHLGLGHHVEAQLGVHEAGAGLRHVTLVRDQAGPGGEGAV